MAANEFPRPLFLQPKSNAYDYVRISGFIVSLFRVPIEDKSIVVLLFGMYLLCLLGQAASAAAL
jgi:hypothetical protein